jgi:hypothetical protein
MSASSSQALDISGRKMQMDNKINMKPPSGQPTWPLLENGVYVVDGTLYISGLFPDEPTLWGKTAATDAYWQKQNQAERLAELLNVPQVAILSPEIIQSGNVSVACDVLRVTPNLESFWALVLLQPGIGGLGLPPQPPTGVGWDQMIKNASMTLWVSQTNGVPIRADLSISMEIGPTQVPTFTTDLALDMTASMLFHDYGQTFSIALPQGAKDAIELNLQSQ